MSNKKIVYDLDINANGITGLDKIKKELNALQQYSLKDLMKINTNATESELKQVQQTITTIQNALNQSYSFKLDSININTFRQELAKSSMSLNQIQASLSTLGPVGDRAFKNLATSLFTTNQQLKQSHGFLDSMAKTLGNTIKWSIASGAINNVTGSIRKAWSFTKALDESLTNIQIVTNRSADDMSRFAKQAQKTAKELGTVTTAYTNAALIYYQQGLEDKDVQARTETTLKAANVTGQSAAEVSEQLTAVWNGYKVVAEEAEKYIDKLAAVAATTAADLEELSTGMSKVASAANAMGVDIDQLSAQLSTIVSVTRQDASVVGTALKTIYARMGDLQVDGVDEFGTKLGDVSGKMRQMGIEVTDQQGNLRDMGAVIEEVAKKWGSWTSAQQQAAAVAIAGKRQYNNLIALFENWDMYESALNTSQNSEGTLQKQQDIYINSLEGKLSQLKLAGEKVYDALFDSDSMKDFIGALTVATEIFANFVDNIGGGGAALGHLGIIAINVFKKQIANGIATAWNNMSMVFTNASLRASEMLQFHQMQLIAQNSQNKNLQQIVQLEKEQLNLDRFITNEQRAQFNEQLKLVSAAQDKLDLAKSEELSLKQQLDSTKELLKTQKLFTTVDSANLDPQNADKRISGAQIRNEKGHFTSDFEFNLESEAGRQAASTAIDTRLSNLKDAENQNREMQQFLDTPQFVENSEDMSNIIGQYAENADGTETFAQGFINEYQGNPADIEALIKANTALEEAVRRYSEAAKETEEAEARLAEARTKGADTTEAENQVMVAHEKQQRAVSIATDRASKVANEQQKVIQKDTQALKESQRVLKTYAKDQEKAKISTMEATNALNKAIQGHKKLQAAAKSKAIITNVTNSIAAIGTLASSINSLIQCFEILNNTEMTGPEKALALFQNLGMTIPMLVGSIGSVITGITAMSGAQTAQAQVLKFLNKEQQQNVILTSQASAQDMRAALASAGVTLAENANAAAIEGTVRSLNKKQTKQVLATLLTNQNTAAATANAAATTLEGVALETTGTKGMVAGLKIQAGFWPILVIGLAIIAVIGTIALLFAAFGKNSETAHEKAEKALKKEQEALSILQEEYRALNEEITKVKNTLEELNEKQKIINSLTIGTEEWTKAVQENNSEILDLLSNYSELAPYIGSDASGVLAISSEGKEVLKKKLEDQASKAKAAAIGQQAEVLQAKNQVILTNTDAKSGGTAISEYDYTDSEQREIRSNKSLAEIVKDDKMDDLIDILSNENNLKDSTVFLKAMKDADIFEESITADEQLAQSMLNQAGAIYSQISSTEANTLAIKSLESAFIAEYYKNNEDRSEAKSLAAWDAIAGARAADLAKSKDITSSVSEWDDPDDTDGDYEGLSEDALKYYAQSKGVAVSDLEVDSKTKKVKVKGESDDTAIDFSEAVDIARKQAGAEKLEEQTDDITNLVNKAYSAGGELINLAGGKSSVTFDEKAFTVTDLENLDASRDAMFEALDPTNNGALTDEDKNTIAQSLGYKDYVEYERAYNKTKTRTSETIKNIGNNMASTGLTSEEESIGWDAFKETSDYTSATISQLRDISAGFEQAFKTGGQEGVIALQEAIESFSGDPETQAKVAKIASEINWMDINAANEFRVKLEEANISVDSMGDGFEAVVSAMTSAANTAGAIAKNFNSIRSSLAEIQSLTSDLKTGDILSDEDYQQLIKYNAKAKEMFMLTADGYKFIGSSGKILSEQLSKEYLNINSIKTDFETLRTSAENFKDTDIKVSNSMSTNIATAETIVETDGWQDLLASQGNMSSDAFLKAMTLVNDPTADKTSQAYKDAEELIKQGITDIANAQFEYESGNFSSDRAEEFWATGYAKSWSEVESAYRSGELGNSTYTKAETYWKNNFLQELGFTGINVFESLGADELEQHLKNIRQLELDYYQDIENKLNVLGNKIEKVFGTEKIALLNESIQLQEEKLARANSSAKSSKETFEKMSIEFLDGAYDIFGIDPDTLLNANDELDLEKLRKLQLNYSQDDEEFEEIEALISMWDKVDEAAIKASEAAYDLIDTQIEVFKYQTEIQIKLAETQQKWIEFARKFQGFAEGSFKAFDQESAVDMINNAFDMIDIVSKEAAYAVKNANLDSFGSFDKDLLKTKEDAIDNAEKSLLEKEEEIKSKEKENATILNIKKQAVIDAAKIQKDASDIANYYQNELNNANSESLTAQGNANTANDNYNPIKQANDQKRKKLSETDARLTKYFQELGDDYWDKEDAYFEWKNLNPSWWPWADKEEKKRQKETYATWTGEKGAEGEDEFLAQLAMTNLALAAGMGSLTQKDINEYLTAKEDLGEGANKYFENFEKDLSLDFTDMFLTEDEINKERDAYIKKLSAERDVTLAQRKSNNIQKTLDNANKDLTESETNLLNAQNDLDIFTQDSARIIISLKEEYATLESTLKGKQNDLTNFIKDNPFVQLNQEDEVIFNAAAFEENWDEAISKAQTSLESFQEQLKTLYDGYLQAQDELVSLYDTEIEKLSTINSILTTSSDLWKVIGKNSTDSVTSSLNIANNYARITVETAKSYSLAKTKLTMIQNEYDKLLLIGDSASEEQLTKLRENLATATQEVMEATQNWMTAISTEFSEKMSLALNNFVKEATGLDIDGITEEWSLYKNEESRYLDNVNSIYEIEKLTRNFEKSIDETDNIAAQNKLNKVMQEQLNILKEKDKLSQYDLDRANAMYELTLKQIALEEAQQTANKMKLTRDTSGNYTYQYVADQDKIAEAEAALAEAENNLYNMDKDRTSELVENYYSTMTEAENAIAEAMAAGDLERVERLKKYYFDANDGLLAGIQKELGIASENLNGIGQGLMGADWTSSLKEFSDAIVNSNLSQLANDVNTIVSNSSSLMTNVISQMNTLLGEKGPVSINLDYLTKALKSSDTILEETANISQATTDVLTQLPPLTALVGDLANNLETYGEKYQNWLKNNVNTTDLSSNTDATKKLTDATDALREAFEDGFKGTFTLTDGTEITIDFDGSYNEPNN